MPEDPPFAVGEVVWVRLDDDFEMEGAAIVVGLDCEYEVEEDSDEEDGAVAQTKHDGIRVKLVVSNFETTVPPTQVRQMTHERSSRLRSTSSIPTAADAGPKTGKRAKRKAAEEEDEEGKEKSKKQRRSMAKREPKSGPKATGNTSIDEKGDKNDQNGNAGTMEDDKGGMKHPHRKSPKCVSKLDADSSAIKRTRTKQSNVAASRLIVLQDDSSDDNGGKDAKKEEEKEDDDDEKLSSLKKRKTVGKLAAAKKSTAKKVGGEEKTGKKPAVKKAGAEKKKAAPKKRASKKKKDENIKTDLVSSDSDDDDRPFKVHYSPTARAMCRRCDEFIKKGEVRVTFVPVMHGRPGYTICRHLKCIVFSEQVKTYKDIGGWKKLHKEDFERLKERIEESKVELEEEQRELQPDELVPVAFQGETRSAPKGLAANLLPFQVEGVSWMYHQEVKTEMRGGILADEMGMGKTLQTIVTILDNRPMLQHSKRGMKHPVEGRDLRIAEESKWHQAMEDWKHEMVQNNIPKSLIPKETAKKSGGGARAGTLVICPVIALSQWKSEIEKFSEPNTLSVVVYHGPNRSAEVPREMLRKYDVVLTTFQVLEADFRKMTSPNKVKCPNCGGKFKIDKLRVHLKYFCGEGAQRTEAQARQRRGRNRHNEDEQDGSRGGGGGGGNRGRSLKRKGKSAKAPQKKKTFAKKGGRVRGGKEFDSESELSEVEGIPSTTKARSLRSAAVSASKRMSKSKKDWGGKLDDSDESSDSYSAGDTSSDDESEEEISDTPLQRNRARSKKLARKANDSSGEYDDDDDEGDSDSDDSDAMGAARRKQADALRRAKAGAKAGKKPMGKKKGRDKGKESSGKKGVPKKSSGRKSAPKKRNKGKKPDDSSSESSDGDDDDNDKRDPFEDIDLDGLMKEAMEGSQMSVLHSFSWWRIVLDEAHFIKTRSSQTAGAAFALIGIHRWCLSGTPLQNRVGEFYSLIRFLRIDPMAHYFCRAKGCDCKSLHYRMMNGVCQDCNHGSVQHFSHFNKFVLNPIQRSGYKGDGRRAMFTLKNEVLDKCLLRRTKETRAEDMNLPPRLVTIKTVRLHPVEEDFYNALYTQTRSSFNDYVADGTLLNNYAHVFDLLMRMRQAVDHPYLVVYSKKDNKGQQGGPVVANGSTDCDICHEPPTSRVVSSCCQAAFCRLCVQEYMAVSAQGDSIPCPSCRNPFSIDLNQQTPETSEPATLASSTGPMPSLKEMSHVATGSILRRINLAEFATSSKIEALMQELLRMRQTSPGSKAIVFSQFVNMLDLVRWRLHSDPCLGNLGLGVRALHGGMNVKARDASLKEFREDNSVRVLLMSLKAGGVALNLTVANHIYLLDPWWNPAAEMQAIDRTHRLGQYRAIRAVRFIAENTVEERILQLQEKKRLVFDGTVGRDAGSLQMLTAEDMQSLFA